MRPNSKQQFVLLLLAIICITLCIVEAKRCRKKEREEGKCLPRKGKAVKRRGAKKDAAPHFRKGPPSDFKVFAREGGSAKLVCNIVGFPKPNFSWLLNYRPLPQDKPQKYKQRRGKLVVKDIGIDDVASYTCIAENEHGSLNFTYLISVLENMPLKDIDVVDRPQNQTAHVGDSVIFKCRSEDWPRPQVFWTRTTHYYKAIEVITTADGSDILIIHNVTKRDSGVYTCHLESGRFSRTLEGSLAVIDEGESLPFEPRCALHARRQVLEDFSTGCKTAEPVDIHYCMGSCGRSYYTPQLMTSDTLVNVNQTCNCCVGIVDQMRIVQLTCPLGQSKRGFYTLLRDCKCQACNVGEELVPNPKVQTAA